MNLIKIVLGGGLFFIAWYFFPLYLAIEWAVYIILPLILVLVAVGLVSDGTYNLLKEGLPKAFEDIRQKRAQYTAALAK